MAKLVDVRDMGENYGVGTYTLQSVRAGDVLMEEAPIVFTQSLASQGGPVGVRCCRGCGMIITTLADECRRLLSLRHTTLQKLHCANNDNNDNSGGGDAAGEDIDDYSKCKDSKNVETISSHALYETLKEFSASRFFCHSLSIKSDEVSSPCGDGMACAVRFCSEECRDRYLNGRGGRFLLVVETTSEDEPGSASETMATMPCDLRKPSAQTIMRFASSLDAATLEVTWLSKAQILRTLDYLIENFNERLLLIMSLFARCLNDTFADTSISLEQLQSHFTEKLHELVSRFAEGAARPLTKQQRAFLRFSWKCVCRWLDLCCLSEKGVRGGAEPFLWLPLQLYLRCFWLADANVHMFVVVSPVYSLLCQQLPTLQSIWQRKNDDKSGGSSSSRLSRQMNILRELFRVVDPFSAHATGVALYDATTKINHSCVPSVRFAPTHGRVRAVVVALRDIEEGEEIRTSYIDVSAHASRMERREYLLSHYGFDYRYFHQHTGMGFRCLVPSRSLLRVSGPAVHDFLQGLFTNDVRLLHAGGSIWGCFLQHRGRVMCDAYIYQLPQAQSGGGVTVLVDVHRDVAETLRDHLLDMRMRKRLDISNVENEFAVVASSSWEGSGVDGNAEKKKDVPSAVSSSFSSSCSTGEVFEDPRSFALPAPLHKTIVPLSDASASATDPPTHYKRFLCTAGVGEGPDVFRPLKSLPFEANTDFLRGVSFHKGCYLGQELTHRTHVMLVTRKRTVPLRLSTPQSSVSVNMRGRNVKKGEALVIDGQKVGEVLTMCGDVGLGLLRLRYVDSETRTAPGLQLEDGLSVTVTIPSWWEEKEVKKMLSQA